MSTTTPLCDTVVQITVEEIDPHTCGQFADELAEGLRLYEGSAPPAGPDHNDLVVDLSAVSFLDSTGIRLLIEANQVATEHGGRVVLRGTHGVTRRCLEV